MPQGYGAVFAIQVKQEDLEKLNLKSYNGFMNELKEQNVDLDEFAFYIRHEIDEPDDNIEMQKLHNAFNAFQEEFKQKFNMRIALNYHNKEEEGSYPDQVDGGYFALYFDEVYQLTDNAKTLNEKVPFDTVQYVVFG